jgi:hypothetical protein
MIDAKLAMAGKLLTWYFLELMEKINQSINMLTDQESK